MLAKALVNVWSLEVGFGSKASLGQAACRFRFDPVKQTVWRPVRDFAFGKISAASQPFLLRALSYMRELPRERAAS
jgi:hypothetical protein